MGVLFWDRWSSSGPTWFEDFSVNPIVSRSVPAWLGFPADEQVLVPIAVVMLLGFLLRFIPATNVSRAIVKPFLLFLALRYLAWRTSTSLNLSHPASIATAIGTKTCSSAGNPNQEGTDRDTIGLTEKSSNQVGPELLQRSQNRTPRAVNRLNPKSPWMLGRILIFWVTIITARLG